MPTDWCKNLLKKSSTRLVQRRQRRNNTTPRDSSTNSPDEGTLLETSRIEHFYLFLIVASENPSLGVVKIYLHWLGRMLLVEIIFEKK